MRRAAKVDASHEAIVQALRAAGCRVQSLAQLGGGVPDLLVKSPVGGVLFLLELKDGARPPSKRALTKDQKDWIAAWGGGVAIVNNVAEALAALEVSA